MVDAGEPPSPQKITGQLISVFNSAALLAALQLELFTALGDKQLTGEQIADAIRVRPTQILNVLALSGVLERVGDRRCGHLNHLRLLLQTSTVTRQHPRY